MSMSCEVLLLEVMQLVCVFLNQKCVPLSACLASNTDPCPPVCFLPHSLYNCTSRKPSKAIQSPPLTGRPPAARTTAKGGGAAGSDDIVGQPESVPDLLPGGGGGGPEGLQVRTALDHGGEEAHGGRDALHLAHSW